MDLTKHKAALFAYYKDLPSWAKGVIVVGTAAVAVYGVHAVVKANRDRKKKADAQAELVGFVNDLDALIKAGVNPTFQESQYKIWADNIMQQFQGCDPSIPTCSDWLFNISYSNSGYTVLQIITQFKNDADFLALQAAWASRTYDACGIWTGDVGSVTLSGAISDELAQCEIKGLNQSLASLGLTYKF